jgi:hypothetical protein
VLSSAHWKSPGSNQLLLVTSITTALRFLARIKELLLVVPVLGVVEPLVVIVHIDDWPLDHPIAVTTGRGRGGLIGQSKVKGAAIKEQSVPSVEVGSHKAPHDFILAFSAVVHALVRYFQVM